MILESPSAIKKRLSTRLDILWIDSKWISGAKADKIKLENKQLCALSQTMSTLKVYDRQETRLDHFWIDTIFVLEETCESLTEFVQSRIRKKKV